MALKDNYQASLGNYLKGFAPVKFLQLYNEGLDNCGLHVGVKLLYIAKIFSGSKSKQFSLYYDTLLKIIGKQRPVSLCLKKLSSLIKKFL